MNPLTIDETNGSETKRIQLPLVFRAGTSEGHNKEEKHRRERLKECFDLLKKQLPPTQDDKRRSNLTTTQAALWCIQTLKRKERELEQEMERLVCENISAQQRLAVLKKEISSLYDNVDFSKLLPDVVPFTQNGSSTSNSLCEVEIAVIDSRSEPVTTSSCSSEQNGGGDNVIPILAKNSIPIVTQSVTSIKEVSQPVQTTSLSVLPMTYPVNQDPVQQKFAIVPKDPDGHAPPISTHFITTLQEINGKVVPLTQYLVKPTVVFSTASPRPS